MSVLLQADDGRELKLNAWNWGVLHHQVERAGVLPDESWASLRAGGGTLSAAHVEALRTFLLRELAPRIPAGSRMFFDGSVTDVPDDGTFYRAEAELWKNYSLHHAVLARVLEFLAATGGEVQVR